MQSSHCNLKDICVYHLNKQNRSIVMTGLDVVNCKKQLRIFISSRLDNIQVPY